MKISRAHFALILIEALIVLASSAGRVKSAPPEVQKAPILAKVGDKPAIATVKSQKDQKYQAAPAFAPEDCLFFPGEMDESGLRQYLVQPYKAGVYRVIFWTKGETEYSTLVIDATGGQPIDPVTPPKPKEPPVDPNVDQELLPKLQAAYARETTADKATALSKFGDSMLVASATCKDTTLTTTESLITKINKDAVTAVGAGKLYGVGQVVADYLGEKAPWLKSPTTQLDRTNREQASELYRKVAYSVKAVKP